MIEHYTRNRKGESFTVSAYTKVWPGLVHISASFKHYRQVRTVPDCSSNEVIYLSLLSFFLTIAFVAKTVTVSF